MLKRMLQLTGGLLAVSALVVATAAATAGASPIAKTSGGGSGCQDNWPPHSSWGNGWYGHGGNGNRPYWRGWHDGNGNFGGHSWDSSCDAFDHKGKVARVMVAVERKRGSKCQSLSRSGKLGRAGDCSVHHWFPATGTTSWHHEINHRLPRGSYHLRHRAIDAAGNHGTVHVRHARIR
jgi:hypothetical protein